LSPVPAFPLISSAKMKSGRSLRNDCHLLVPIEHATPLRSRVPWDLVTGAGASMLYTS
jgi:hypothetical protein